MSRRNGCRPLQIEWLDASTSSRRLSLHLSVRGYVRAANASTALSSSRPSSNATLVRVFHRDLQNALQEACTPKCSGTEAEWDQHFVGGTCSVLDARLCDARGEEAGAHRVAQAARLG